MILYSGLYFSLSEQWKFARETNEFEAKSKFTFIMHANGVRESLVLSSEQREIRQIKYLHNYLNLLSKKKTCINFDLTKIFDSRNPLHSI